MKNPFLKDPMSLGSHSSSKFSSMTTRSTLKAVTKSDFDLVFFHTEDMPFKIVQTACNSHWCHVALLLVLTEDEMNVLRTNVRKRSQRPVEKEELYYDAHRKRSTAKGVYMLESTTDTYPCAITGNTSNGVKLCLLTDRLKGWTAGVFGMKRVSKVNVTKKKEAKEALLETILPDVLGLPYERDLLNLAKAWVHYLGVGYVSSYDETSMFCTELITHVFTRLGLLHAQHDRTYGCCHGFKNKLYTDEDLVLEDYVHLEKNFLSKETSWLSYNAIELINVV
jgi:hypothetical protein